MSGQQDSAGTPLAPPSVTSGSAVIPGEPRPRVISPAQLTIVVVCFVSIYFIISFYGKSLDSYRVNQRANDVRRDVAQLEVQIKELRGKVAYLSTESYVETTAREKLNLVKPGDLPVVVLAVGSDIATVASPPPPSEYPKPFAELGHFADWLYLFFGNR